MSDDAESTRTAAGPGRYALLVLAVGVIALAGFVGYVLYPRFDLPAAEGAGLLGLAAVAGLASFFSPCSFPLMVGLLGRQAVAHGTGGADRQRPAVFGGALALGAAAFLLLAGAGIAAGGRALFADVTFPSTAGITIRAVVGALLIVLGLVQSGVIIGRIAVADRVVQAPIVRSQARLRRRHPVAGYGLFGFGYVLAGFG